MSCSMREYEILVIHGSARGSARVPRAGGRGRRRSDEMRPPRRRRSTGVAHDDIVRQSAIRPARVAFFGTGPINCGITSPARFTGNISDAEVLPVHQNPVVKSRLPYRSRRRSPRARGPHRDSRAGRPTMTLCPESASRLCRVRTAVAIASAARGRRLRPLILQPERVNFHDPAVDPEVETPRRLCRTSCAHSRLHPDAHIACDAAQREFPFLESLEQIPLRSEGKGSSIAVTAE